MFGPSQDFFSPGTMASADFSQFVVTTHFFFSNMSTPNTPVRPPRVLTRSFPLYLPHLPNAIRVATGLCFVMQTYPCVRPYMRFLFVRPEFCPLRDLSTPKIRLSSDSASRRTPLPLASPSRYRADSGLSPQRTCAHRAHISRCPGRSSLPGHPFTSWPLRSALWWWVSCFPRRFQG